MARVSGLSIRLSTSVFILCLALPATASQDSRSDIKTLTLSLKDVEAQAVSSSMKIKSSISEVDAAGLGADSQSALLWPRLTVDGSWKYSTQIPDMNIGGNNVVFGSRNVYSVGPTLNYTLFDFGSVRKGYKSLSAVRDSKMEEAKVIRKNTVLSAKIAYFNALLSAERSRLVANSLILALSQARDINNRLRAGASSRLDSISADREVLNYKLQFRQVQSELALGLRELFSIIGKPQGEELSFPLDSRINYKGLDLLDQPTLMISLDSLEKTVRPEVIDKKLSREVFENSKHPHVKVYEELARASDYASSSVNAGRWPKIQLTARTSLDYPNGPVVERIWQNSVGASLTMPLFEASRSSDEAAQKSKLAEAYRFKMDQMQIEIERDFMKAKNELDSLKLQDVIMKENVKKAEELARLYYSSYKAGRSSFLEVQSANLRSLESKIMLARNRFMMLIQAAVMESLIERE